MNSTETKKILAVMMVTYPNYKVNDIEMAVSVWQDMLADYEYNEVSMALKTYITTDTSGFAPSIGQLIDKIHSMKEVNEVSASAVWVQVYKAICDSNYHSQERFAELPKIAQEVIGSPEGLKSMAMNSDFNEDVEKALFIKAYNQRQAKHKELNRLPNDVKQNIGMWNNKFLING